MHADDVVSERLQLVDDEGAILCGTVERSVLASLEVRALVVSGQLDRAAVGVVGAWHLEALQDMLRAVAPLVAAGKGAPAHMAGLRRCHLLAAL